MNKLFKIFLLILVPVVGITVLIGCNEEDKLTGSIPEGKAVDISSNITGFDSEVTAAGKSLTINGSGFTNLFSIKMDQKWVNEFEATSSSITFTVPLDMSTGEKIIYLFFDDLVRASTSIEVVPEPAIRYFLPTEAKDGDPITIFGNNMDYAASVSIGGTAATITSKEAGSLTFTFPDNASTDVITIESTTGEISTSGSQITACSRDPQQSACQPLLNTINGSFEDSPLGPYDPETTLGWNLGGDRITVEIVNDNPHHGGKCVKIMIGDDVGTRPYHIQPTNDPMLSLEHGKTYHMSVWAKGLGIANAMFAVDAGNQPDWTNFESPEYTLTTGAWTLIEYDFTITDDPAYGNVRWALSLGYDGNQNGTLYLDDLRITAVN